jgi:predicted nucleic acid-binding protein
VLVVDASVLVVALADDGSAGTVARKRLVTERLAAPELIDLEVVSVLRRRVASGAFPAARARQAIADLRMMPLVRSPHGPLLERCWELRENVTVYDAAYVALAEALDAVLLTADQRLASAPGPRCTRELIG